MISNHGIAVSSVIIANNNPPRSEGDSVIEDVKGDFSGVVASVPNIPYMLHFYQTGYLTAAGDVNVSYVHVLNAFDHISNHDDNIDVVNMSFGGIWTDCDKQYDSWWQKLKQFFCEWNANNASVFENMPSTIPVRSAGNESIPASDTTLGNFSPSVIREWVLTIGALNSYATDRASDSNYGQDVNLAAQGDQVYTVNNKYSEGYAFSYGTSFAAPLVSGVVALMRSVDSDLARNEVRDILQDTARMIDVNTPDGMESWRHVDADAAIRRILTDNVNAEIDESDFRPTEGFSDDFIRFSFPVENTGDMTWKFHVDLQLTPPHQQGVIDAGSIELLIAPGQRFSVNGGFWAGRS